MNEFELNTSGMPLESYEKCGSHPKRRNESLDDSSVDYVTKRRKRGTPQKCTSLETLTPRSRVDLFRRYQLSFSIIRNVNIRHPETRTILVWKAYCKFVRGAWKKTRSVLISQNQKADACEIQETKALIQLSSLSALLNTQEEMAREQMNELNELSNLIGLVGNDKMLLEECNCSQRSEIDKLIEDVQLLEQELARKRENVLGNKVTGLEELLSSKEEKRNKYRIETSVKKARIEQLCREYEHNCQIAEKMKRDLKEVESNKKLLLVELNDRQACRQATSAQLQRETDGFGLLKKKLVELKEANQVTAKELSLTRMRLIDNDLLVVDLEKQLSDVLEELERLKRSKANWGKLSKLVYATWAAACLAQVIRLVDRRWP